MISPETDLRPCAHSLSEVLAPRRVRYFLLATLVLVILFGKPLFDLICFAASNDFYSYILLMPFVSLYLGWAERRRVVCKFRSASGWAVFHFAVGLALLGGYWLGTLSGWLSNREDALAVTGSSFLCLFTGICFLFLGRNTVCSLAFPLTLLIFMVPFPLAMLNGIETFLQYSSAATANLMFTLSGATALQEGLQFKLPGITIAVAPECSGIHSSWILLITGILAGHVLLRKFWNRALLIILVIPLAIVRNGFRIFVIGQLCIHIGPRMIDSPIHRRGGPLFFLLSLIPFFLLLFVLMRTERMVPRKSSC